jgi:hypothetical protein
MSNLLMIVAGICVVILVFGILKRIILIALVIAALVAIGAFTFEYTHEDSLTQGEWQPIHAGHYSSVSANPHPFS